MDFKKLQKWFMFGALKIGIISILITLILSIFGSNVPRVIFATIPDINVREQLATGVSSNIGTTILGWVTAVIPFNTGTWFWNAIATLLTLGVVFAFGALVLGWFKRAVSNKIQRVALVGLIGSVIPILLQFGLGILSLVTAITTVLYFLILGWLAATLVPKILPVPEI